jgi:hypothetical protein
MAQFVHPASAIILAAMSVLRSAPEAAATTPDVLTTGSVVGTRPAEAGRKSPNQDGASGSVTTVHLTLGSDRCVSLRLPGTWSVEHSEPDRINAVDAKNGAAVEITAHTDADFAPGPGTLIQRAAWDLQRQFEGLIGKPAQVTTLERGPIPSAMRWTATWNDANFAQDERALSLERFIVEPVPNGIVEISVSQAGDRQGEVVGLALETLTAQSAPACPP